MKTTKCPHNAPIQFRYRWTDERDYRTRLPLLYKVITQWKWNEISLFITQRILNLMNIKVLYKWCLRQTQEDGTQLDRDLIPWFWSLQFEAAEVFHNISYCRDWPGLNDGDEDEKDEDEKDAAANVDTIETIQAKLIPVERLSFAPRYYMFGYRDAVEVISLTVIRSSKDTHCTAFSFAKYRSKIDFPSRRYSPPPRL